MVILHKRVVMLTCVHGGNTQRGRREEKVYEHDDSRESGGA